MQRALVARAKYLRQVLRNPMSEVQRTLYLKQLAEVYAQLRQLGGDNTEPN